MDREALRIKLAWQVAYELRTCPDLETLRTQADDGNVTSHLAICPSCREKNALQPEERQALKTLRDRFLPLAGKGAHPGKSPGQVWTLDPALAGWDESHRFFRPPVVLLLERIPVGSGWSVSQLYSDKTLLREGDVELADRFGFAQGWNCYTIREEMLGCCLGGVTAGELARTIEARSSDFRAAARDETITMFRQLEVQVGSRVALPAVLTLAAEYEAAEQVSHEEVCRRLFGDLGAAVRRLTGWLLPETDGIFDLVSGAIASEAPMMAAGDGSVIPVNHVSSAGDALRVEPLLARITMDQWQGDGYLVSGTISATLSSATQLLASLKREDGSRLETGAVIKPATESFLLFFEGATEAESSLDRLQFLLVSHG